MHTALSTYSFIRYPCAMERPLPLEISGVASQDDAYAYVVSWVNRDADEGIRRGCAKNKHTCNIILKLKFVIYVIDKKQKNLYT